MNLLALSKEGKITATAGRATGDKSKEKAKGRTSFGIE
jgi:hypothetical protein